MPVRLIPTTIDTSDVPALDSWGQQEGLTQEYSSGSEENLNPITIDDYDSGEGYGSDDCVSEFDVCSESDDVL